MTIKNPVLPKLIINPLFKLAGRKMGFLLFYYVLICLTSCEKRDSIDCSAMGTHPDILVYYDIGALTDSSLAIFPNNLPASVSFKNNFNQINTLQKSDLENGTKSWAYHTETKKEPCYEYKEISHKNVSFEMVNLVPVSQPNFHHSYARTRYIAFQNYQNLNPNIPLDSTFEIVTVTLIAPLNSYTFIVPLGDVSKKLSNYTYSDTLSISGIPFRNIYHIYADSVNYDPKKVVPQGLYYNKDQGLIGYYLSSGELWVRE